MKKILFVLFALFATTSICAQEDLHNLLHPNTPFPANNNDKTPKKEAKKRSVSNVEIDTKLFWGGLYIIHQKYIVRTEDGDEKTQNGNDFYGQSFALAVKTESGYYVSDRTATPWFYDDEYSQSSSLEPEVSSATITPVHNIQYTDFEDCSYSQIDETPLFEVSSPDEDGFTLLSEADNNLGCGYIVWVVASDSKSEVNELTTYDFVVNEYEANLSECGVVSIKAPKNAIGGVFLIPQQSKVGQLTYKLAGVVTKNKVGEYQNNPTIQK